MPTGAEQRAAIDATFAAILPRIVERQEQYRAAQGRYWQGLSSARPHDKPDSVAADWVDVGFAEILEFDPARLPGPVAVDEYVSPRGAGWVVSMLRVEFDDGVWSRAWQHGPEQHLEQPWREDVAD